MTIKRRGPDGSSRTLTEGVRVAEFVDMSDFAFVRPLLRTRLVSAETADTRVDAVCRSPAPGLLQIVSVALAEMAVVVTRDMQAEWDIGESELFGLAEANVRATELLTVEWSNYNGARFAILSGSDHASAHTRWLGDYPVIGPDGALVVVSHEGNVYAHPIAGAGALTAVILLGKVAAHCFRDQLDPISPEVYWWRQSDGSDGTLEPAATTELDADGNVFVHQAPRFEDLLNTLSETYEFMVLRAGEVDNALDGLERHRQICAEPDHGELPDSIQDLLEHVDRHGAAVVVTLAAGDSRGAVLRTAGPDRGQHLYTVLRLTKDRDLSVFDIETGRLYDPRGRVDVHVTLGESRETWYATDAYRALPYLTTALLEDIIVGAGDPDDPYLFVRRDDQTYIRAQRHEYVYALEYRAGSATEHYRVTTMHHDRVRQVIWAWLHDDPACTVALPWRRIDLQSPGVPAFDSASTAEIMQDALANLGSKMTPRSLELLDDFTRIRDIHPNAIPEPKAIPEALRIDPDTLRDVAAGFQRSATEVPDNEELPPDEPDTRNNGTES